ncbi:MAG: hypothetical protein KAU28_01340, partial [Phycisphaerae bacterium]|nr:hypothetical protein [Phycisphaerae bacterium]
CIMRLAFVIISLAAIALALVHVRRAESCAGHEIQRLRTRQVELRRRMWDQEVRIGQLTAPGELRRKGREMSLDMAPPTVTPPRAEGRYTLRTR